MKDTRPFSPPPFTVPASGSFSSSSSFRCLRHSTSIEYNMPANNFLNGRRRAFSPHTLLRPLTSLECWWGRGGRKTKKEEKKVANEIPNTAATLAWLLGRTKEEGGGHRASDGPLQLGNGFHDEQNQLAGGGRGRSTVQETRPLWSVNGGGVVEEDNLLLNGPIALAIVNGDAEALKIQVEQVRACMVARQLSKLWC